MNTKILQKIGLSENEALIYITLLESGMLNISEISEKSGLNRVAIYSTIPSLKEKVLVSEVKKGKRVYFIAENPENLENVFYETKNIFKQTLGSMKEIYQKDKAKPYLRTFYGKKGLVHVFEDVVYSLEKGDTYYRYSSRKENHMRGFLKDSYKKMRDDKEIQRLVITSEELKKLKDENGEKLDREIVTIPKNYDLFNDNITKIIYANKVAVVDYNTETAFIIENEIFANFEKKIFLLLFKFLKK